MAAVRQGHSFWGNRQIEWAVEAASLPRARPAMKAPIHTHHTGQHGDDRLVELIPWSWPSGSHRALPGWSWGSEPGSGLSAYCTGRGAIQGRTPGLRRGPAPMGSDPTRGRQCGHTGSTGRPGKNGETPQITHTHTHTPTPTPTPTLPVARTEGDENTPMAAQLAIGAHTHTHTHTSLEYKPLHKRKHKQTVPWPTDSPHYCREGDQPLVGSLRKAWATVDPACLWL